MELVEEKIAPRLPFEAALPSQVGLPLKKNVSALERDHGLSCGNQK